MYNNILQNALLKGNTRTIYIAKFRNHIVDIRINIITNVHIMFLI